MALLDAELHDVYQDVLSMHPITHDMFCKHEESEEDADI